MRLPILHLLPVLIGIQLLTFPSLVLNIAGFNLSCSNSPLKILSSQVSSK